MEFSQIIEFKDNLMGKVLSLCSETAADNEGVNGAAVSEQGHQAVLTHDAPLSNVQPVHTDAVNCLCAMKTNPLQIISGSKDQFIALLDIDSKKVMNKMSVHQREVSKVAYCPQKSLILTASRDKTIKIWSTEVLSIDAHNLIVTGLDVNSEETHILSGSRDNFLKLWDMNTGQCVCQSEISRNLVSHIKWAPNSHLAVQSGEDKELRIWDTRSLTVAVVFPKKNYIQTQCDISADTTQCLSTSNGFGGSGCEATLWDIRARAPLTEFIGHREAVGSCSFLEVAGEPDLVVTGSADSTVRLWSRSTGYEVSSFDLPGSGPVAAVLPLPGGTVAAATFNLGVQILRHGGQASPSLHHVASF